MALRKIIEAEGKSVVHTPIGSIENGTQRVSFSAYVKVIGINGDKSQIVATVNFKGETQQFNKPYQVSVSVANGASNFIAQVYEHLKTLPEFDGAEDC
jgi:hypothetical protein